VLRRNQEEILENQCLIMQKLGLKPKPKSMKSTKSSKSVK
jgi:hypothetical protein